MNKSFVAPETVIRDDWKAMWFSLLKKMPFFMFVWKKADILTECLMQAFDISNSGNTVIIDEVTVLWYINTLDMRNPS